MDGLGLLVPLYIIFVIINVLLVLLLISIPIFSIVVFRRVQGKMSVASKVGFGLLLLLINGFILTGTYIFFLKSWFE